VFPLGRPYVVPSDRLGHDVAKLLIAPSATRDRLTAGMFLGRADRDPMALIERALAATVLAEPVEAKLKAALKDGRLDGKLPPGAGLDALAARAQAAGIITAAETQAIAAAGVLAAQVIRVDDFAQDLGAGDMNLGTVGTAGAPSPKIVHKAAA
jgi:acyl-CoA dehydrogenase